MWMKMLNRWGCLFFILCFVQSAQALQMAITVDDLPINGLLPANTTRLDLANSFLKVFKKHQLTGVYGFVNGQRIEEDSKTGMAVLKSWSEQGQLLGNHTFSHISLTHTKVNRYIDDIHWNEPYFENFMKNKNAKYFRYPYLAEGETKEKRNAIRNFLFKDGYKIAPVSIFYSDYLWNNPYVYSLKKKDSRTIAWLEKTYMQQALAALNSSQTLSKLLFNRDIKYILLIHFNAFSAHMLDRLLTAYEQQGVKFISLNEAIQDPVYQLDPGRAIKNYPIFLSQLMHARGLTLPTNVIANEAARPTKQLATMEKNGQVL